MTEQPVVTKELYRYMFYDHAQELIRFNYMRQPNVKIVVNEFGDLVSVEKVSKDAG